MLPPGQPTLLVGAMHAGEIDTVLNQSVKATADVDLWHLTDKPAAAAFVRFRTIADKTRFLLPIVCPLLTQSGHGRPIGATLGQVPPNLGRAIRNIANRN